jgi:hypothetical protein
VLVRLLLGGEEWAAASSAPIAVVDFPDAPIFTVADLDGSLGHRLVRSSEIVAADRPDP